MKILVAIESSKNADVLAKTTLTWAPRGGFNLRIFIPDNRQLGSYLKAIDEANYHEYLDLHEKAIVPKTDPLVYAQVQGYDLLLYLPDDLPGWNAKKDKDRMVIDFAVAVGKARVKLGRDPLKMIVRFSNGARMVRI